MDWNCDNIEVLNFNLNSLKKNPLRRSVSSFGFNAGNTNAALREAKSFTGALPELKSNNSKQLSKQHDPNYYMKILTDRSTCTTANDAEFVTRDISTDKVFVVNVDMLKYRGIQYTLNDVATRWKKDCRMWLWKGQRRKKPSLLEIKERMQNLKIGNYSIDSNKGICNGNTKFFANRLS